MPYFETSAKLNKNIDELISYTMKAVYEKLKKKTDRDSVSL